jgi:hypothetical protein
MSQMARMIFLDFTVSWVRRAHNEDLFNHLGLVGDMFSYRLKTGAGD